MEDGSNIARVNRVSTRRVREVRPPAFDTAPEVLERYLEDAAHFPGGRAIAVTRPSGLEEVSAAVRAAHAVLTVGAQSSLTGGATPLDDVVLSTERLRKIEMSGATVSVGAGVPLSTLQHELGGRGLWLPPVPTFLGATAGGTASTNAAGAATFKYGTTRDWVEGLTVVLAHGDVLALHRGEVVASDDGRFEIETTRGVIHVVVPDIRMPRVPKCSAGYFSVPHMDLVDLFIGAEGTLGVIVDVTFRVATRRAGVCWALVPIRDEPRAIELVDTLRIAAQQTWQSRDPRGVDIAAIEYIDRRALEILREDGVDRRLKVSLPADTSVVLLVQLELSTLSTDGDLWTELSDARSADAPDTALIRFCRMLDGFGALDETEIVLPDNVARRTALIDFREATPASVNRRVARAQAQVDARIHKTAADGIVPFDRLAEMMSMCRRLFVDRGVDLAVWGHISDGNLHPNVVPTSYRDIEEGKKIMLELGREVIAMGGSPLAEHGVGRSPMKHELLRMLYGDAGVQSMRRVKQALDPEGKLARGVLFPFNESA